ncbi:hypothetical protein NCPPB3923_26755 [Burkholderia glumae]|nr:hypothetical protein NCPPB3923_26755 [Burkholderia glumae]
MEKPDLPACGQAGLIPELKLFDELQKLVVCVLVSLEMLSVVQQVSVARIQIGTVPFTGSFADEAM